MKKQDSFLYKIFMQAAICLGMFAMVGCELITLGGGGGKKLPDINQRSPQGTVYLFKTELDSGNVKAATRIFASEQMRPLLAAEKYDLQFEIERLGRIIANRPITELRADTLSPEKQRIRAEFSYSKYLTFTTVKVDDFWFISSVIEGM